MTRALTFLAAVHRAEDRRATFYLLNTSPNRNRWAVTDRALEEALPTVIGKPLGCGPGYRTDRHYPEPMDVGAFTEAVKPDSYALATAEVTDREAWRRLAEAEWGPISIVITSHRETCSECGEDLTGSRDPFAHTHIAGGSAHLAVHSFVFNRADFIDSPAYPQAGRVPQPVPLPLLAGFYQSQSTTDQAQGPGAQPGSNPEEEWKMERTEEENQRLKAQTQEQQTRIAELEAQLRGLQEKQRGELLDQTVKARLRAGLAADQAKERDRLTKLDDEPLRILLEDAQKASTRQAGQPKAQYTAGGDELQAAIEDTRMRLFGHRRGA